MVKLKKVCLLCFVWLIGHAVQAQTCLINQTDTLICAGTTVSFTVSTSGGTPTAYNWNFGNGFTANTATPSHTYTTPGTFTPTVTVTFSGGATCTANGKLTRVFAKPIAKFTITSEDTMCFRGNQLCVDDQSSVGSSNAPIKKRIFQLSNGFIKIENNPPFSSSICYIDSIDEEGHLFSLVLEVTDTNNCVDRVQKIDSIVLLPKLDPLSFTVDAPPTCYTTVAKFTNTSAIPLSKVKSFKWDFGDGSFNTTSWDTVTHVYSGPGLFVPKLLVTDFNDCPDFTDPMGVIQNIIPDSTIYLPAGASFNKCYKDNKFSFQSKNPAATIIWEVFDKDNLLIAGGSKDTFGITFNTCGIYKLRMNLYFPDCFIRMDTFLHVYGPKAMIENILVPNERIVNGSQCEIHDTVYFKTPVPYLSCSSGNGKKNHIWDFGDAFAPPCTTDTRNGINVGVNCNFSVDSMEVKHAYTAGKENCYMTKLRITDSLTGCWDADSIFLPLKAPDAGPDLTAVPPRRGLYFTGTQCMGSTLTFMFDETLPECSYEKIWINLDSACGADRFVLADTTGIRKYQYAYDTTCSEDGWITVGLIVKNGYDKLGNPCYDTAWYHHFLRLFPIAPNLDISVEPGCLPNTVVVKAIDSIQYNLSKVRWNFNPFGASSNDTLSQLLGPNDSLIFSQSKVFNQKGPGSILATFTDILGCSRTGIAGFALGYKINLNVSSRNACVNDSILLEENVRYYKYGVFESLFPVPYWSDTARASANKERIWWDLGDGKGFSQTAPIAGVRYTKPGSYTIRIATQDSLGCLDTLVLPDFIKIVQPVARIGGVQSTYYCAPQIVAFKDSTVYVDSLGNKIPVSADAVNSWLWDFGDATPNSSLQSPAHNYRRNGSFRALLTVTTQFGCSDTESAVIIMKGPEPSFVISDTIGCQPFTPTFINTTDSALRTWTWYFGDPSNNTLTTLTKDSVKFTYTTPGVYSIRLLGTENVFNPNTGNTIICNSFFPDPLTDLPERKVYVMGTPPMDVIVDDTICPNEPLVFRANGDTIYNGYNWIFGDGGSYSGTRPDTTAEHVYLNSGVYKMQLIPVHSLGYECVDTVRKNIFALNVKAQFRIDSSNAPEYSFINQSVSGVRYEWNFGSPEAGASNTSNMLNGVFTYRETGTYNICLTTYNNQNCWDSSCLPVTIYKTRVIIPNVFTPDNSDGKNDAFDIDILGYTKYELKIYNRWGAMVFEGDVDGIKNDGINWNGLTRNEGEPCPAGTYYFIFTYQLMNEAKPTTVHGTITLIRDK